MYFDNYKALSYDVASGSDIMPCILIIMKIINFMLM